MDWLTPQVALQAFMILIAGATLLWRVPSKGDINSLKADIKSDINSLKTDIKDEMKEIRQDLRQDRQNFTNHLNQHIDHSSTGKEKNEHVTNTRPQPPQGS